MRRFGILIAIAVVVALFASSVNELTGKLGFRWQAEAEAGLVPLTVPVERGSSERAAIERFGE